MRHLSESGVRDGSGLESGAVFLFLLRGPSLTIPVLWFLWREPRLETRIWEFR